MNKETKEWIESLRPSIEILAPKHDWADQLCRIIKTIESQAKEIDRLNEALKDSEERWANIITQTGILHPRQS